MNRYIPTSRSCVTIYSHALISSNQKSDQEMHLTYESHGYCQATLFSCDSTGLDQSNPRGVKRNQNGNNVLPSLQAKWTELQVRKHPKGGIIKKRNKSPKARKSSCHMCCCTAFSTTVLFLQQHMLFVSNAEQLKSGNIFRWNWHSASLQMCEYVPKAPPISAPLVGMLTLTIPQSEPLGLKRDNDRYILIVPTCEILYFS